MVADLVDSLGENPFELLAIDPLDENRLYVRILGASAETLAHQRRWWAQLRPVGFDPGQAECFPEARERYDPGRRHGGHRRSSRYRSTDDGARASSRGRRLPTFTPWPNAMASSTSPPTISPMAMRSRSPTTRAYTSGRSPGSTGACRQELRCRAVRRKVRVLREHQTVARSGVWNGTKRGGW